MGAMSETFAQLDNLETENRQLKAAVEKAVKYMSASCHNCPLDSNFGCKRPVGVDMTCAEAVKRYLLENWSRCTNV